MIAGLECLHLAWQLAPWQLAQIDEEVKLSPDGTSLLLLPLLRPLPLPLVLMRPQPTAMRKPQAREGRSGSKALCSASAPSQFLSCGQVGISPRSPPLMTRVCIHPRSLPLTTRVRGAKLQVSRGKGCCALLQPVLWFLMKGYGANPCSPLCRACGPRGQGGEERPPHCLKVYGAFRIV